MLHVEITRDGKSVACPTTTQECDLPGAPCTQPASFYGPGDVTGIDPQVFVRMDPHPGATDFEPNYFPTLELGIPDLPWLLTPQASREQLQPWLVLVTVPWTDDIRRVGPHLPQIKVDVNELPKLSESYAWAHVQRSWAPVLPSNGKVTGKMLSDDLSTQSQTYIARLISPRRLKPAIRYLACLVPAFKAGVEAGLGWPTGRSSTPVVDSATNAPLPAWTSTETEPVILPLYHYWEFTTSAAGDFETLAAKLESRMLPASLGRREMTVSNTTLMREPGGAVLYSGSSSTPEFQDFPRATEGALRPLVVEEQGWNTATQQRVQGILDDLMHDGGVQLDVPVFGLPRYGQFYRSPSSFTPWVDELNRDPRNRVATHFGTLVVQRNQEALMASAWTQLGEFRRNKHGVLRFAQLGLAVSSAMFARRIAAASVSPDAFLHLTSAAHARVRVPESVNKSERTVHSHILSSYLPNASLRPAFRRLLLGPIGSRATRGRPDVFKGLISRLNRDLDAAPNGIVTSADGATRRPPAGTVPFNTVYNRVGYPANDYQQVRPALVESAPGFEKPSSGMGIRPNMPIDGFPTKDNTPDGGDPPIIPKIGIWRQTFNREFKAAAIAHQAYLTTEFNVPEAVTQPPLMTSGATELTSALALFVESIKPQFNPAKTTISDRPGSDRPGTFHTKFFGGPAPRIQRPTQPQGLAGAPPTSPTTGPSCSGSVDVSLTKVMHVTPTFPQPMFDPLRELSQDLVLPGLSAVPENTVALLVPNYRFIEAFMLGANYEMAREMVWRDYPVNRSGTFFRNFWSLEQGANPLPCITDWHDCLGYNAPGTGPQLVLLIRGDLLKRYPDAVIYAAKAVPNTQSTSSTDPPFVPGSDERYPLFRVSLLPDITLIGFPLTVGEARGSKTAAQPGWFFVIQQNATAPRFGLEETPPPIKNCSAEKVFSWAELSWQYPAIASAGPYLSSSLDVNVLNAQDLQWKNSNSGQMAAILFRRPYRLAIHASTLLKPGSSPETRTISCATVDTAKGQLLQVGGTRADGSRWRMTLNEAILAIEMGQCKFVVAGSNVVVSTPPSGQPTLSVQGAPNVWLTLPKCEIVC